MSNTSLGQRAGRHRVGFTLLELMIVIAVIMILVSMLAAALGRAKAKAHAVKCLGNLKQLQLAWQLYADDNEGRLVPNWNFEVVESAPEVFPTWARGVMTLAADNPDNTNTLYLTKGLLGAYAMVANPFRCPSDRSVAQIRGIALPRVRTAAMNHWMGFGNVQWSQGQHRFLRMSDIVAPPPSQAFVLTMQREDAIEDAWMRIDPESGDGVVQWPESYHNRAGNFAFADGHVAAHRWRDSRTAPPIRARVPLSDWTMPLAKNPDAQWIREHATSPLRSRAN